MYAISKFFLLSYLQELLYKPASVINASHSVIPCFTKYGKIREAGPYKKQILLLSRDDGSAFPFPNASGAADLPERSVCKREKMESSPLKANKNELQNKKCIFLTS